MSVRIYRIERLWRVYRATFRDRAGQVVTNVAVQAAVLPQHTEPAAHTTWTNVTYSSYAQPDADGYHGEVQILIVGPDADTTGIVGALFRVPDGGGDLYFANPDEPELDVTFAERVDLV